MSVPQASASMQDEGAREPVRDFQPAQSDSPSTGHWKSSRVGPPCHPLLSMAAPDFGAGAVSHQTSPSARGVLLNKPFVTIIRDPGQTVNGAKTTTSEDVTME